jgi:hypothetical protein
LQSESGSEIEDLMNPKDELKKKIVALANTMRQWNEHTKKARKSVREQIKDIIDLGLKRKMDETELRKLINDIFLYHGIHPSWLRKLLPEALKDTSKTRISYLQRQEIEKEQQRLLQRISESKQASNPRASSSVSLEPGKEFGSGEYTSINYAVMKSESPDENTSTEENKMIANRSNETSKKIQELETQVQQLSELFIARANLQTPAQDLPLIAQIDPVKKLITSIQVDKSY